MATMPIAMVTQFSVTVPDKPGELARLTELLCEAGVNLAGITSFNLGPRTCVRFLPGKTRHLKQKLEAAGYLVLESGAFQIRMGPGNDALNRLMTALGKRGINVTSCYGHNESDSATMVVCVDRPLQAAEIIALCQADAASAGTLTQPA